MNYRRLNLKNEKTSEKNVNKMLPTFRQLIKFPRIKPYIRNTRPALLKSPQKKVLCLKVDRKTPRKPNSAMRRIAVIGVIKLLRQFIVFIPGDAAPTKNPRFCDPISKKSKRVLIHLPSKNNVLLIQGGGPKDLPGVSYRAIRGAGKPKDRPGRRGSMKYHLKEIPDRVYSRSRYGACKQRFGINESRPRKKNSLFPTGQRHLRKEKRFIHNK
jgi:small subunit ribosomal protein S12